MGGWDSFCGQDPEDRKFTLPRFMNFYKHRARTIIEPRKLAGLHEANNRQTGHTTWVDGSSAIPVPMLITTIRPALPAPGKGPAALTLMKEDK